MLVKAMTRYKNETWLRRQSQISLFHVAQPTLKNRVKLSRRVSKFVGLFVSRMVSSFENCINVVFCKRSEAISSAFAVFYLCLSLYAPFCVENHSIQRSYFETTHNAWWCYVLAGWLNFPSRITKWMLEEKTQKFLRPTNRLTFQI